MLRVLGLTLVLVASAATAADAGSRFDRPAAGGIETALQQSAAVAVKRQRWPAAGHGQLQLQLGGALALAQPSLRATVSGPSSRRIPAYPMLALGRAAPTARPSGLARWLDLNGASPGLAYPVTDALSLGLGYRYLRSEDLVFKVAKTGSLDSGYQSHNVLFQAHWEF